MKKARRRPSRAPKSARRTRQVGPILLAERQAIIAPRTRPATSTTKAIDRHSAHEILSRRAEDAAQRRRGRSRTRSRARKRPKPRKAAPARQQQRLHRPGQSLVSGGSRTTPSSAKAGRVASGVFNTIARELMRGILGTPSRPRRRR